MSELKAIVGAAIFDGKTTHHDSALLIQNGKVAEIKKAESLSRDIDLTKVNGGTLVPGFVDLQVNGGGGVLFNDQPTVEGIKTICAAHAQFGTTSLLPTLITDTPQITKSAIEAGIKAGEENIAGFIGLHLEGPHLSIERKGAHEASLIRPMEQDDLEMLLWAKTNLPNLMVTVAPESVTNEQIKTLSSAGVVVSLGHTNCTYETAMSAIAAGAHSVTHLFNAMSPLSHREPGLVSAALNSGKVFCGLIADSHHVKAPAIKIALAAKKAPGKLFLVTDAMSIIGTEIKKITLNGRTIHRQNGVLTLEDGTLAGADLGMISAVDCIQSSASIDFEEAVRMASLYPAQCLGITKTHGHLSKLANANFLHINDNQKIESIWLEGDI